MKERNSAWAVGDSAGLLAIIVLMLMVYAMWAGKTIASLNHRIDQFRPAICASVTDHHLKNPGDCPATTEDLQKQIDQLQKKLAEQGQK